MAEEYQWWNPAGTNIFSSPYVGVFENFGCSTDESTLSFPIKIPTSSLEIQHLNLRESSSSSNHFYANNNTAFKNPDSSSQFGFLTEPFEEKASFGKETKSKLSTTIHEARKISRPETSFKRPRIETPSPYFKVRKEKLRDRITALQQLVSPFGKTDTASVLHEAIHYINFLHDQINVLSNTYMKNEDAREQGGGKDLSRGLCLMPISGTLNEGEP